MNENKKAELRAWMNRPERHELTRRLEARIAELRRDAHERPRRESS